MASEPSLTNDPVINLEIAIEGITMIKGWLRSRIRRERELAEPDEALVAYLEKELHRWIDVERSLSVHDQERLAKLVDEYSPIIRKMYGKD